jgi:hypothetical protein
LKSEINGRDGDFLARVIENVRAPAAVIERFVAIREGDTSLHE